jgi:hypothetical protein
MVATLVWTKTVLIQVTYFSVIYYHTPFMGPKVGGNDIALTWKLAVLPFLAFLYWKLKSKFLWRPRMVSVHTKFSENRPNASEFEMMDIQTVPISSTCFLSFSRKKKVAWKFDKKKLQKPPDALRQYSLIALIKNSSGILHRVYW